jgi:hypothetical protein
LILPGKTWIPAGKCSTKTAMNQLSTNLQEGMCPIGDQRICCDFDILLSISWFTADSTNAVEMR